MKRAKPAALVRVRVQHFTRAACRDPGEGAHRIRASFTTHHPTLLVSTASNTNTSMSIATTSRKGRAMRRLSGAERLKERKRREAEIIAQLLDTPSKKRGSTGRLLSARQRRLEERNGRYNDSEGESSSGLSSVDSESSDASSDEGEGEDDEDNIYGARSASSSSSDSGDDTPRYSEQEAYFSDSSEEETAVTSDEDYAGDSSDDEGGTKRRRRTAHAWTPSKRIRGEGTRLRRKERILETVTSTPHLPARPLNMPTLTLEDVVGLSAQARAKRLLHVGAAPERLPCREDQYEEVLACVEDAVEDGIGGCVYVSGVPGVGKTATIREAIRSLRQRAEAGLTAPFKFVEINGMKLNDAQDAYGLLWQTLSGMRCSNRTALRHLGHHFAGTSRRTTATATTVVLMDELDQLVTTRQEVMYNMFNWPNSSNSRLIVVAVANTMDLPERILNPKVASRLGMTRITFKPYSDKQLVEIVHSRLGIGADTASVGTDVERALIKDCDTVLSSDAIVYISKRVSNVSGDARRMLDVCRRAIDSVEMEVTTPGSTPRQVTIVDVKRVLDSMVKSGKVSHLIKLPLQAKVVLISILACSRRSGVAETDLATILAHQRTLCRMQAIPALLDLDTIAPIMAQLCSLGLLIAVGSGTGSGKAGIFARFLLACQEDEVRLALEQDQDRRLRNML